MSTKITRRSLKEHCKRQACCADCQYYAKDVKVDCWLDHEGTMLLPYEYPEEVLDQTVRISRRRAPEDVFADVFLGSILGAGLGMLIVGAAYVIVSTVMTIFF